MDLGEKMTVLENQIYNAAVAMLQQAEIPSTIGRVIMDGVYRRFVESAYYISLQRAELLEQELAARQQADEENASEVATEVAESAGKESDA